MPLTPQITLTATLQDVSGANAGSTASPAVLRIALAGFGPVLPCIAGTSNLARVGPEDFIDDGTGVTTTLWGNDVITPTGTYYAITLLDGDGNIVQCGAYRFSGTEAIDLSDAPQIVAPYGFVLGSLKYLPCAGTIPGTAYVAPGSVVAVSYNGVLLRPTIDYTMTGAENINLTFETGDGDTIYALCVIS
jgi:hypothetical protein